MNTKESIINTKLQVYEEERFNKAV